MSSFAQVKNAIVVVCLAAACESGRSGITVHAPSAPSPDPFAGAPDSGGGGGAYDGPGIGACVPDAGSGAIVAADTPGPTKLLMSDNGLTPPALLVEPSGAIDLVLHRYDAGPCLKCNADRLVQRWDGMQWNQVLTQTGWPGSIAMPPSLAWDRSRGVLTVADSDLQDPYHPPLYMHVWQLIGSDLQELGMPLGNEQFADHPALTVDSSGVRTLAWIDSPSGTLRFSRFVSGAWRPLPAPPDSTSATALAMQMDSLARPLLVWATAGSVHLGRWDDADAAWTTFPALQAKQGTPLSVALALDAAGNPAVAYADESVSVVTWNGTAWTTIGTLLGKGAPSLVQTSHHTLLLATSDGVFELTDCWHLLESGTILRRPVTLAAGDRFVVAAWLEVATSTQQPGISFRIIPR